MPDEKTELEQQPNTAAEPGKESEAVVEDPKKAPDAPDGDEKATAPKPGKSLLADDDDADADDKGEDKGDDDVDKAEGAPEKYEAFTLPEGFDMPEEQFAEYTGAFKELNLSQAQAQKLVDTHVAQEQARIESFNKQVEATHDEWVKQAKADPKADAITSQCRAALKHYGDAEVMEILGGPWGDNPAVRRFLAKVGATVTEGSFVEKSGEGEVTEKDRLAARYPTMGIK